MKFTLKEYQDDAVRKVLANLTKAQWRWRTEGERSAFSLTAATGAGKTVMAAAVLEALFHGDENYDFDADRGAVVLWFSDDPALNEQSRFRILQSANRLTISDLVVVQNTFNRERFDRGRIYFLNTQKISRTSLLVRGHEPDRDSEQAFPEMRPDLRSFTIWDTIRNTIDDPKLTLYLVLDEAHRGMGSNVQTRDEERFTIVRRLINGAGSVPPIPVVWGISATVERFNAAMAGARDRSVLPDVAVDPAKVQESGLLKDTIMLDVPRDVGSFDTVLVRRAIDKLRESTKAWADYAREQGDVNVVLPLLILQVPNRPDANEIGRALDTMFERWPDLSIEAVANVLGEHTTQSYGRYQVPYISPERVQESTWVRVLIAKDAISSGWDCPRAEVMVSFRPAQDRTHITQLLGRMVRTPLARRIPGNDRLNAVDCLLPFFDPRSVREVADALRNGTIEGGDGLAGRQVLINPREMVRNEAIPEAVWQRFVSLPSESLPSTFARPVRRLTLLGHELAEDGLLPDAGKVAHSVLHKVLDAARVRYATEIKEVRSSIESVEGRTIRVDLGQTVEDTAGNFVESADLTAIEGAYHRAAKIVERDLARTYAEHLAEGEMTEEALINAYATIAAMTLVPGVKGYLDQEADELARIWFTTYRIAIKSLTDERQDVYREIRAMSSKPEDIDLTIPSSWIVPSATRDSDGEETAIPSFEMHLMSDEDGYFPAVLNSWESAVLDIEMARPGFLAWYRNPPRPSQDSLGVAYTDRAEIKMLRPDFIFFAKAPDGSVLADIVDPHGPQLADALPKLRGLARYAEEKSLSFRRIEAIAKIGSDFKVLDLTKAQVRQAVEAAADAASLYVGAFADYL